MFKYEGYTVSELTAIAADEKEAVQEAVWREWALQYTGAYILYKGTPKGDIITTFAPEPDQNGRPGDRQPQPPPPRPIVAGGGASGGGGGTWQPTGNPGEFVLKLD